MLERHEQNIKVTPAIKILVIWGRGSLTIKHGCSSLSDDLGKLKLHLLRGMFLNPN